MLKTLLGQVREYKKDSLLTPLFTALEVLMEVLIPFVTAAIIDQGIEEGNMQSVYAYGALMLVMAFLSLVFGALAGRYAARAASGFAANLREGLYASVQAFSFSNIDKYSTAGLVTRMTTDVTNLQNAWQMILRIAVRAPLMLILSMAMCFFISAELSAVFLAAIVVLAVVLIVIMLATMKLFACVFQTYDDLNGSVQENVSAIRVVKAFVREDYEKGKFRKTAEKLYKLFMKAEGILALNNPVMMLVVYGCIIALSWLGARQIVLGNLTTGELTSLFSYVMSVLMSLMMLSMIFVMITMSAASGRRVAEVLEEKPALANPEQPRTAVADGSIDFDHVHFSYGQGSGGEALRDIDIAHSSGRNHRRDRRHGQRQIHARQPDLPPVRCGRRQRARRRRGCARLRYGGIAHASGRGTAKQRALFGYSVGKPALGPRGRHRRGVQGSLPPGLRGRFCNAPAARL